MLVTRKIPEVALQRLRSVPGIELDIYEETSKAIPAEELKKRAEAHILQIILRYSGFI